MKKAPLDPWIERALQGLVFWIGYRRAQFRGYAITEAPLVAEACCLIQSNLPDSKRLYPERMYKNLVGATDVKGSWGQKRADLVICDSITKGQNVTQSMAERVSQVIEVKKGAASDKAVDKDFHRLFLFLKNARPECRAFLFQIFEAKAPTRFCDRSAAKVSRAFHTITVENDTFCVSARRLVKAASSFNGKETAHYALVVEVFN